MSGIIEINQALSTVNSTSTHKLSLPFSSFIIKHFEYERRNNKSLNNKATVAAILRKDPETVDKIRDEKEALVAEEAGELEKAYGMSISSLLKKELEGKSIPKKLQKVHKAFIEFSKDDHYLKIPVTAKTTKQLSILEQEEELVERIKGLKQSAEELKLEVKELEAHKLKCQKEQVEKIEIKSLPPTKMKKPMHPSELVGH